MNILYISNASEMYGANISLLDILNEMQLRECNVVVVVMKRSKFKKELIARNIKVYELDYTTNCDRSLDLSDKILKLYKNLKAVSKLAKIIEKEKIDIIHTNASNIDIGAIASLRCKLPHIWHVREMLVEDYGVKYDFPLFTNILFHFATQKIAISEYVKENRKLGKKSIVLYDGFNTDKYNIERKEYFPDKKLKVLYCGFISKQKGVMDVVRAVNYLVRYGYKDIELYIAGGLNPYAKRIQKYVKKNNLEEKIFFCGYQKDLYAVRSNADIAVMSSRSEALGRVTVEAMLSELIVIGADAGATSEIIQNGVTGILYTPGDIKQLAHILLDVMKNKEINIEMIKNAKRYALENFDIKKYVDDLWNIYKEII